MKNGPSTPATNSSRTIALGLAFCVLASGCVTYSKDKAIARMSGPEKVVLAQLSKINKSTTKSEVRELLGKPERSEKHDSWEYYINVKVVNNTVVVTSSGTVLDIRDGAMGPPAIPGAVAMASYKGKVWDSEVRVFFKKDCVRRIHWAHPGLDNGWAFDLLE